MLHRIQVCYFALLRELAGKSEEMVAIEGGEVASHVYTRLAERYHFPLALSDIRVAVNDDFTGRDHPLNSGDKLVFLPPVAGG